MIRIFRAIWAIYGISLFLTMTLASLPVLLFNMAVTPGKRALHKNIFYLHHPFSRFFFFFTGIRLRISGKENIRKGQSYVIVSNHRSSIDFIANATSFPGIFRFLAKQELQKIPIFGWVVKKMCLTVDRRSAMSRARSVVALKNELEEGVSVFIYPEGSRNRTEEAMAPFFDGAFRVAIQTGAPILPMVLLNTDKVCYSSRLDLAPGILKIRWLPEIPTQGLKGEDSTVLKDKVWQIMKEAMEKSEI